MAKPAVVKKSPAPVSISREMKAIQRKTGGRVTLTLTGSGSFVAHAFPTAETVRVEVLADISRERAEDPAYSDDDVAWGLHARMDRKLNTAIAYGTGKTAEDALAMLNTRISTLPKVRAA